LNAIKILNGDKRTVHMIKKYSVRYLYCQRHLLTGMSQYFSQISPEIHE